MSWDVLLLRLPEGAKTLADMQDTDGEPLGSTGDVRRILSGVLPDLDLSDPTWGILETVDSSIEFSIGSEEPCVSVMLHVRGLDDAMEPIRAVCNATGWQALDCSDGELIDFAADPGRGLRAWREYRDRAGLAGPVKGVSLTTREGHRVFFDDLQPAATRPSPRRRRWWQLLVPRG